MIVTGTATAALGAAMMMSGKGGGRKGKKVDTQQIDSIANEFKMDGVTRRRFGDYIEELKASGIRGTKNEKGDFTYKELREIAKEFIMLLKK